MIKDMGEGLYKTLFENASDGIALLKLDGDEIRFIDCNARLATLLGIPRDEIRGHSLADISPSKQRDGRASAGKAMEIVTAALAGESPTFIWQHHRKDEAILDLEVSLNTIDIAGERLVVGITRDVTERERTANALRESTIKLNAILDHHYQLTGLLDLEGRLLAVNKTALELVGADEAEVLGNFFWKGPWWNSSQEAKVRAAIKSASEGEFVQFESTHPSADGEIREINFSINPVRDDKGNVVYLVPQGRDITEQKRDRQEREQLITDLEAQNTELERFAYTVSHDLRTPLTTISNYAGALQHDLRQGDIKRAAEDAKRIEVAGTEMGRLLNDVLELSRIGRVVGAPDNVPLAELAHEVMDLAANLISSNRVSVVISDELPTLYGDRMRLREVLQNLLENAIKYMGSQPKPRVEIGARQEGSETTCYVRDNGMGIKPPYQERIFDLFDQLDQSTDGSGIGLALAKRIVEVHGGRIWCESEGAGHGSTFCFTIPPRPTSSKN